MLEKHIRIVKKIDDDSNLEFWLSLSYAERMARLEIMRQEVNKVKYGTDTGLQRVYRVVKKT